MVADLVAQAVVDEFEVVQVDEEQRGGGAVETGLRDRLGHVFGEQRPVVQAGELVVVRLVVQPAGKFAVGLQEPGGLPQGGDLAGHDGRAQCQRADRNEPAPVIQVRLDHPEQQGKRGGHGTVRQDGERAAPGRRPAVAGQPDPPLDRYGHKAREETGQVNQRAHAIGRGPGFGVQDDRHGDAARAKDETSGGRPADNVGAGHHDAQDDEADDEDQPRQHHPVGKLGPSVRRPPPPANEEVPHERRAAEQHSSHVKQHSQPLAGAADRRRKHHQRDDGEHRGDRVEQRLAGVTRHMDSEHQRRQVDQHPGRVREHRSRQDPPEPPGGRPEPRVDPDP
ncbi:MAG TPA: hypothetical protein VFB74_13190 [Kribbellaceae bacterium]|nr:hypothetical protein [Kribbellaceae bacterium]